MFVVQCSIFGTLLKTGVDWIGSWLGENARQLSVSQIRMHCSAFQTIRMHRGQEGRVVVVEVEEEERRRLWRVGLTCTLSAPHNPLHSDTPHHAPPL